MKEIMNNMIMEELKYVERFDFFKEHFKSLSEEELKSLTNLKLPEDDFFSQNKQSL